MKMTSKNADITTLNDQSVVCRNEGFELRRTPCCINLYDKNKLPVMALNSTSALIWENCNGELRLSELLEQFYAAFPDVPHQDLRNDIIIVLQNFLDSELIYQS